jgi:hypothetical protein
MKILMLLTPNYLQFYLSTIFDLVLITVECPFPAIPEFSVKFCSILTTLFNSCSWPIPYYPSLGGAISHEKGDRVTESIRKHRNSGTLYTVLHLYLQSSLWAFSHGKGLGGPKAYESIETLVLCVLQYTPFTHAKFLLGIFVLERG